MSILHEEMVYNGRGHPEPLKHCSKTYCEQYQSDFRLPWSEDVQELKKKKKIKRKDCSNKLGDTVKGLNPGVISVTIKSISCN